MTRPYTVVGAFNEIAGEVGDLVDAVEDWHAPAIGEWDVAGLCGHVIRIAGSAARYAAGPQHPATPLVPGAGGYYRSYLAERAGLAPSVAARGREEAGDIASIPHRYRAAVAATMSTVGRVGADMILDTRYGALPLEEYLRTRILELTVHGLDLAHALGRPYVPPHDALDVTLRLLGDIALADPDAATQLVLVLTGRPWGDPGRAFPVLS